MKLPEATRKGLVEKQKKPSFEWWKEQMAPSNQIAAKSLP